MRVYGPDGARPIQDVRAGDRVFSYVDGRLETHAVTVAWQSKAQPGFKVRTRNRAVTASANHSLLRLVVVADRTEHIEEGGWPGLPENPAKARRGDCFVSTCPRKAHARGMCDKHWQLWKRNGEPRIHYTTGNRYDTGWARLDELRPADLLVQPRVMLGDARPDPELADGTSVDPDVAWLLGAMVGDGTVADRGLHLCLYGGDRERATAIIASRWRGKVSHGQSYGLASSNSGLATSLTELGMRRPGPEKRVPHAVWQWAPVLQRAFLDGYCDADGHRPADQAKHGQRTYSSASEDLIEEVRALHMMLGDPVSNLSVNRRTKPITIKGKLVKHARPLHTFTVWREGARGEALLRRTPGLAEWLDAGEFTLARVRDVTYQRAHETWHLEVDEAYTFVADGVVLRTGLAE